jgi:hypothetical protein
MFLNFALEYAIRKVQEKPGETEIEWDTAASGLIDASKEVGLEINIEKTKYMLLSHHQNAGQNWDIKIANR